MVWRLTKAGYQPSLKRQGADRGAEGGPRMGSVGQALLRANGNEQSGRLRRARHDDAATATRAKSWPPDWPPSRTKSVAKRR